MGFFHIGDRVVGAYGSHMNDIGEVVGYGSYKFQEDNYMVKFNNSDKPCECLASSLHSLQYARSKLKN